MTASEVTWEQLLEPGKGENYFAGRHPEFSTEEGFHAGTAWWLGEFSRLSYRPALQGRMSIARDAGLEERFFVRVGGAECSLYESTDAFPSKAPVAVLVFKSTDSLRQWMSNLDAIPMAWQPCGHVHGGFAKAFAGVWDELEPRLNSLTAPVFITGHSLGGALATLAMSRLGYGSSSATYTFGSPRVGNTTFAEECLSGRALYRIVNHLDLVCSLPRPVSVSRRLQFTHAGETFRFDAEGACLHGGNNPGRSPEPSIRQLLKDAFQSTRPPRALADHAVQLYVDRLRLLAEAAT